MKRCYDLWYNILLSDVDKVPGDPKVGHIVELGSGSSYIKELCPQAITSDVEEGVGDLVIDGRSLPFDDESVRAILMTHVFHHIPDIEAFLREAERTLIPGGVISIIEVSHTPFARVFFRLCHPEPYDDTLLDWSFDQQHSMLDSNQALSWNVFFRDHEKFKFIAPKLSVTLTRFLPWFSYILSGGVSRQKMVPDVLSPLIAFMDTPLKFLGSLMALHWHLTVVKIDG